jgi:heme O synthase-like polyprenyltransferase
MDGIPDVSNNRLPKTQTRGGDSAPPSVTHVVGTALVQAAAVVVVAKIVDAVIEAFMSRRRARQEQPQRNRREEHAAV